MSVMARAMRPLPSSKGWTATNHRWAVAARITPSVSGGLLNHSRKAVISPGTRPRLRALEVDPFPSHRP